MKSQKVKISIQDIQDLIWMARRYADYRSTYAPSMFNVIFKRIMAENPSIEFVDDETLMHDGAYMPWAQDGMYDPETGAFDARPKTPDT